MTVRSILRESLHVYRAEWLRLIPVAAAILGPAYAISVLVERAELLTRTTVEEDGTVSEIYWGVGIAGLATLLIGYPLIEGGVAALLRRGEAVSKSWRRAAAATLISAPALAFCSIVVVAGTVVGLILFVVPGLFLLSRWAVVSPVVVLEHRGLGALSRSWELVRGYSSTALGLIATYVLLYIMIRIATLYGLSSSWVWAVASAAVDLVLLSLYATSLTVLYYRLLTESDVEPIQLVDRHRELAVTAADRLGPRGGLG